MNNEIKGVGIAWGKCAFLFYGREKENQGPIGEEMGRQERKCCSPCLVDMPCGKEVIQGEVTGKKVHE